jgi:hypothetical protein
MALILCLVLLIMNLVVFIHGTTRFPGQGSTLESENCHEIMAMRERPGWRGYILTGIILCVIGILFRVRSPIHACAPFIRSVLVLIIAPITTVLIVRLVSRVCDTGVSPAPAGYILFFNPGYSRTRLRYIS